MSIKSTIINTMAGAFLGATAVTSFAPEAAAQWDRAWDRLGREFGGQHRQPRREQPTHEFDFHPLKPGQYQAGYYNNDGYYQGSSYNDRYPTCRITGWNPKVGRKEPFTWRGSDCVKPIRR